MIFDNPVFLELDRAALMWFNSFVGSSQDLFYVVLFQSNKVPWVICALILCCMWFLGKEQMLADEKGGCVRSQSRAIALLVLSTMICSFMIAKSIQSVVDHDRPLVAESIQIPIPPHIWHKVKVGLETKGSFPSDHSVMFFVLVIGGFCLNRWLGFLTLGVALYFSSLRIAIGFHWLSDIVAGALIGIAMMCLLLKLLPRLRPYLDWVVSLFEQRPAVMYTLAFLFLMDCANKFEFTFGVLDEVKDMI
ncbi:MAG: phosphatase PAP2 family protein [Mariprofundaceae bacterium]|nr:phosphatase PAP2 family protein [Mariprofundaceae bacterium]